MVMIFSILWLIAIICSVHASSRHLLATYDGFIKKTSPTLLQADERIAVGYHNNSIYLIGGYHNKQVRVEYDILSDTMTPLNPILPQIYGWGQYYTQQDNILYAAVNTNLYSCDLQTKCNVFQTQIIGHSVNVYVSGCTASSDDYIFVLGGVPNIPPPYQNVLEILNISSNTWISGPTMITPRAYFSCAFQPLTNELYAIGGNNATGIYLQSIERIHTANITTNANWEMIQPLLRVAKSTTAVVHASHILVIGGFNLDVAAMDEIQVIECYAGTVTSGGLLDYGIRYTAVIIANNVIYSFGGHDGTKVVDTWQYLNLGTANTDAPTTNTYPPTANTDQPTTNTNPPTMNTYLSTMNIFFNTYPPTMNTYPPTMNTVSPSHDPNTNSPTVNTNLPTTDTDTPTLNTNAPSLLGTTNMATTLLPTTTESTPITFTKNPSMRPTTYEPTTYTTTTSVPSIASPTTNLPTLPTSGAIYGIVIVIRFQYEMELITINVTDTILQTINTITSNTIDDSCLLLNNYHNITISRDENANVTVIDIVVNVCNEETKTDLAIAFYNKLKTDLITNIEQHTKLKISDEIMSVDIFGDKVNKQSSEISNTIETDVSNTPTAIIKKDNSVIYVLITVGCVLACIIMIICVLCIYKVKKLDAAINEHELKKYVSETDNVTHSKNEYSSEEKSPANHNLTGPDLVAVKNVPTEFENMDTAKTGCNIENVNSDEFVINGDSDNEEIEGATTKHSERKIHKDSVNEGNNTKKASNHIYPTPMGTITIGMNETPNKQKNEIFILKEWLESTVGLAQYYNNFVDNGYNQMQFIAEITNTNELFEIGIVSKQHQIKILQEIRKLTDKKATQQQETTETLGYKDNIIAINEHNVESKGR